MQYSSTALTIEKKVSGEPNGADDTFTFTVTLTDNSDKPYVGDVLYEYNNAESTVTFDENGQASLSLHSDESVILFNIPVSTKYEVEEIPTEGFVLTEHMGTSGVIDFAEDTTASFTNTYEQKNVKASVSVTVVKSWQDNNNQDGIRPNDVTVKLFADGADTGKTVVLNTGNNWAASFTDLPQRKDGTDIAYTLQEVSVTGYTSVITGNAADGFTITNSHTPETVAVEGTKTWNDSNNQDGKRPASITVNVLANGTIVDTKMVTAADGWNWSFTNLAKNEAGKAINYTVTENIVAGYTATVSGYNITNSRVPSQQITENPKSQDPNIPQTGDNGNYLLWIVLMLASAGLLVAVVYGKKKWRHNK